MRHFTKVVLALIVSLCLTIPMLLFALAEPAEGNGAFQLNNARQHGYGTKVFYEKNGFFSTDKTSGASTYYALNVSEMDFAGIKQSTASILWTANSLSAAEKDSLWAVVSLKSSKLTPGNRVIGWMEGNDDEISFSSPSQFACTYYVREINGAVYLLAPTGKISHFFGGGYTGGSSSEGSSSNSSSSEGSSSNSSSSEGSSSESSSSESSSSESSSSESSSSNSNSSESSSSNSSSSEGSSSNSSSSEGSSSNSSSSESSSSNSSSSESSSSNSSSSRPDRDDDDEDEDEDEDDGDVSGASRSNASDAAGDFEIILDDEVPLAGAPDFLYDTGVDKELILGVLFALFGVGVAATLISLKKDRNVK
ncbi:MAG: hypothetical protein PHD67_04290 [Oscillospiraceae bacterium]|nr:hypothetical protein [Oscillospiraceae bacterium]